MIDQLAAGGLTEASQINVRLQATGVGEENDAVLLDDKAEYILAAWASPIADPRVVIAGTFQDSTDLLSSLLVGLVHHYGLDDTQSMIDLAIVSAMEHAMDEALDAAIKEATN